MKDLTIINGFVLIDTDSDTYSMNAYYVHESRYNEGFFNNEDIETITIDYLHQVREVVEGIEYPSFKEVKIMPNDSYFDHNLAFKTALEVANELINQKQFAYV